MKLRRLGLGLLATIAVAFLGLRWALQNQVPSHLLQSRLEKDLGHPVRFRNFQVTWDARLSVDDLELLDPQGQAFLKVRQARLDLDRSLALQGQLVVRQLVLQQPLLEMSGARWRSLQQKQSGPPTAREFPLLLQDLSIHWLRDDGKPSWQVEHWGGSLPPVPAGLWKLALQGDHQAAVEASGQGEDLSLRLIHFPVSMLATVSTGAVYPSLEPQAEVDLDARLSGRAWEVQAQLRSQAFQGPLHLTWKEGGKGELRSQGGKLPPLGEVGAFWVPFEAIADGWKVGPARFHWRGADWEAQGRIQGEKEFQGSLLCSKLALPLPPPWKGAPGRLQLLLQGDAQARRAHFSLEASLAELQWDKTRLGTWRAQASGDASEQGLQGVRWRLHSPRASWPGRFSWNSRSGDLELACEPLQLENFLPGSGWRGTVNTLVRRKGEEAWMVQAGMPRLASPWGSLEQIQLSLQGNPPQWKGTAHNRQLRVRLQGANLQPQVQVDWRSSVPNLKGEAHAQADLDLRQPQLVLALPRHSLHWKGLPLPQLRGALVASPQGWKGKELALSWSGWKLPLEIRGGPLPSTLQLHSQLSNHPLSWQDWQGSATAELDATLKSQSLRGELRQLQWKDHPLGDWKALAEHRPGQPAHFQITNAALAIPKVGKVKASLSWTQGQSQADLSAQAEDLLKWGPLRAQASLSRSGLKLKPSRWGPFSVTGSYVLATRAVKLAGAVEKLSLGRLPGVPMGVAGVLSGTWACQGRYPELGPVRAQGQLRDLKILGQELGQLPWSVEVAWPGPQTHLVAGPWPLRFQGLAAQARLDWKDSKVSGQLQEVRWNDHGTADLDFSGVWTGTSLSQARLQWGLEPPLVLQGQLGLSSELQGELKGQSLKDLALGSLPLEGQAFGPVIWKRPGALHYAGEVRGLVAGGQALGKGQLSLDYGESLTLTGQGFGAAQVAVLQQRYPGLSGALQFDLHSDFKTHQGGFSLTGAAWKDRPFPDLEGRLQSEAESWKISSLKVALEPPLEAQGRVWPGPGQLDLSGRLQGQSLAQLSLLGGATPPADVSANLVGDFRLQGQGVHFAGRAQAIRYRGVDMGEGSLRLDGESELDGELILDQPLEVGKLVSVPPALQSVLPAGGLLSGLRLRGVHLAGSFQSPSVSPLWARPEVKIGLPGGIQIKL